MGHISTLHYTGDLHNDMVHLQSGDKISTDAPVDNNGKGEAFSPTDLLAVSLAACAMTIMGIKAKALDLDLRGTRVEIEKEMALNPRRVARVSLDFYLSQGLDENSRRVLEEAAHTCPVSKSLSVELVQEFRFHYL
ncbi:OsmC family protein [Avibacterium paragallinarum]|uniref:Peroxiredoxin, Ohr subfamily n=1 Tax=Avibacterium paragallinarum TaxID=728 RepID=A0A0F5EY88_AVIPA|nr:OsmC family protein [Avibacterium paragallinarum]KAA6209228.1 OsmC family protein [Avibacterium paragallinarum]KKB01501.1 OsmC family protein [Avibacterium paragallinarum]QIR11213.1 OsmC family protein [Avibacterium paragallinarum]QLD64334.1 OsmC family protein [Avibacterium paragallinarum]RZN72023.1 OsmC family peroxiredoxin [Avibacterium paragallinarum]